MFKAYHVNFDTIREFGTFAEAEAWVTKTCFEAVVFDPAGTRVATFSPIAGWRRNPEYR